MNTNEYGFIWNTEMLDNYFWMLTAKQQFLDYEELGFGNLLVLSAN